MSAYLLLVTLLCAAILNPVGCHGEKDQHKLLFVFGDSLFDPGNNQYLSSSHQAPGTTWPYGINNHNHSTGRLSDGLLAPDFIALYARLNILQPILKPGASFKGGANFASAGGAVLDGNNDQFMNLKTQLSNFKKLVNSMKKEEGEAEAKKVLLSSVYLFSLGGNDYFSFNSKYPNATATERREYMHMVIGNLTLGIKELYGIGMRKLAFQNVGPLGCYPSVKAMYPELNGSCVRSFLTHAYMHNEALSNSLMELPRQLPGFKYGIFDYYHALADRIKNPTKYGFKVGQVACCGSGLYNGRNCGKEPYNLCSDPNEYVLFDGAHHTQRTNQQLAQLMWNGPPSATAPYTVKQLFQFH